jgi:hypothetical protein
MTEGPSHFKQNDAGNRVWFGDGNLAGACYGCSKPAFAAGRHGNVRLMQITKQLALFLENRPGTLARVCDALAAARINIYAISTSDTVDHIVVRMVVSDPAKAMLVFEEHGTLVVEDDVLMITGDNKPGSLARLAHRLAGGKVNIEYAYCATPPEAKRGLMILRVSDAKKAMKLLNS